MAVPYFRLRLDEDIPQARSAQIRVGVWYWDAEGLIVNVPLENGEENILIQTIAVFDDNNIPAAPDLPSSDLVFGEQITLLGYDIPTEANVSEILSLSFAWEARQNITEDYRLFFSFRYSERLERSKKKKKSYYEEMYCIAGAYTIG